MKNLLKLPWLFSLLSLPLMADSFTFTTIDFPGAFSTEALGINDSGQVVGAYNENLPGAGGFLLSGGNFTTVNFPGPGIQETFAEGINDRGQVVGGYGPRSIVGARG
jgi:uncharacterized membrane protein